MHVLLIEDNPADTRYMQEALKEAGGSSIDLVCDALISKGLDRLKLHIVPVANQPLCALQQRAIEIG